MDEISPQTLRDFFAGNVTEREQEEIAEYLNNHPELFEELEHELQEMDVDDDDLIARIRTASLDFTSERAFHEGIQRSKAIGLNLAPFSLPHEFGHYTLLEKLREGSTCSVYRALDHLSNNHVAIKILVTNPLNSSRAWDRFSREVSMISRLSHLNIVQVLDTGIVNNCPYLTMELLKGFDLSHLVARVGPLDVSVACEIIRQAAIALAEVASAGLVHRDVKPSNIFLTEDGVVKLLDLGVARNQLSTTDTSLTETDHVVGTLEYMAPEQLFDSREADTRSDIYGLGCTFYKLLIGVAPFAGKEFDTAFRKAVAHSSASILPLHSVRSDVPKPINGIVQKMCAKDPAQRPQTYQTIIQALTPFATSQGLQDVIAKARESVGVFASDPTIRTYSLSQSQPHRYRYVWLALGLVFLPIVYLAFGSLMKDEVKQDNKKVDATELKVDWPKPTHAFDLPAAGTYAGQNRNENAHRSDLAYTIFSEDVFCYGQEPPSRKIGGVWVRDRSHPLEKRGYYVFRQWPSRGSIVVVTSYDGKRYSAPYFNGPNVDSEAVFDDPSLSTGHGEFSGTRISDDCSVDGTYDRGFKSDIHKTWKETLSQFAPSMLHGF